METWCLLRNVLASADRLARELHPEKGSVEWRPVLARRKKAAERIAAVEAYSEGDGRRSLLLLSYFGETLNHCAGCGRCRRRSTNGRLDPIAAGRYRRLSRLFADGKAPWGGSVRLNEEVRQLPERLLGKL